MDRNLLDQTPTREAKRSVAMPTEKPGPETAGSARKPYEPPRLIEHGRLAALTFGPSGQVTSDRNAKEGFASVDSREILAGVVGLSIERWSYRGEPVRHL